MWPEQNEKVVGGERLEKEVSVVETGQAGFLLSEMGRAEGLEQRGMECDLEYETVYVLAVKLRGHGSGAKGRGGRCSGLRKQSISQPFVLSTDDSPATSRGLLDEWPPLL